MTDAQHTLETECERLGVYVGRHPTGALTLTAFGSSRIILPEQGGWRVQSREMYGRRREIGTYQFEDLDKLLEYVQDWAQQHPFKH